MLMAMFVTAKCSVGQMCLGQIFLTKIRGASNQGSFGQWNSTFLHFQLLKGGATEKVLQFCNAT
jgi:hypothetical protein